ncbi:trehalose import ATP-binding protein SugC [Andreesenia angusta]|uniref:Trehalose import ATP-binding protein SugC n=1 Tax=Andreesenia angusta TaxID=39480 RepID=A0A1S1V781_9FIRM|nr:sn-glycerol-3-phosphate ABC transporter ATP-binding protein UgpC [Andreesenia angusta]OHW62017.1 trehalose import ATP-binding protein SugC [Andreesenia angusta]
MSNIVFDKMGKVYPGEVRAVSDFSLEIKNEEFVIFVGPSGCGKSTVLRMIAGLEEISEGKLYIDEKVVNDVEPKDRDIAMVFQNYALYPHMTVYENMAFGLKMRKVSKDEIDKNVKEAANILGIGELLSRKPKALSGGQRQRVALGRAIVRSPKVFLMDEPLSNLDAKLRVQTRAEIVKLHKRLKTTFIYVTHDQTEAMTMGDKIVVMKDGFIQQFASPQELYNRPVNVFVAGFIGSPQMNFLEADIAEKDGKLALELGSHSVELEAEKSELLKSKGYAGKCVVLGLRAEDLSADIGKGGLLLKGIVEAVENMGSEKHVFIKYRESEIVAKLSRESEVEIGDEIEVVGDISRIHYFDRESEERI